MFPVACDTIFKSNAVGPRPLGQLITVAITLFNYERFIKNTLADVAAQTHVPIELIIVDDASTDASVSAAEEWLQSYHERFQIARLVKNRANQGLARSRNLAFSMATSEYVFVLDADNGLYPRALTRLLEAVENSGRDGAYSQLEFFGEEQQVGFAGPWDRKQFRHGNYVDAMALVTTSAWAAVGGYSYMDVVGWEDYDFWCKWVAAGLQCAFVPEILCRYRVHNTSMLRTETNSRIVRLQQEMLLRHPHIGLHYGL